MTREDDVPEFEEDLEDVEEDSLLDNPEIPDVPWAEVIQEIENPVLKEETIEKAEDWKEKAKKLDEQCKSGEIDKSSYLAKHEKLRERANELSFQADLASVDLTWDKLGDLAEDYELLISGDLETLDRKEKNKELIREVGVEKSQEITDHLLEEEKIDEKEHQSASRLIRNQK